MALLLFCSCALFSFIGYPLSFRRLLNLVLHVKLDGITAILANKVGQNRKAKASK